MNKNPIEVIVAAYSNEADAKSTLATLEKMKKDGAVDIIDAAVMIKDTDGKIRITETAEITPGKGAKIGAVAGAIVGVLFPPSILGAGAIGAVAGALAGKWSDQGLFNNTVLKDVANSLDPGTSALIAVVEHRWIGQLHQALSGYLTLATQVLDADALEDMTTF